MKLEKILFKNGNEPSISEEILEQLQENIDKAINTHPIIKMRFNRQTLTTSGSYGEITIPLNSKILEKDNEKEYLRIGNNEILIGEDVNLVDVVAHIRGISYVETKGDKEFKLMNNNNTVEGFYQKSDGSGYWGAEVKTKMPVNKGDRISLNLQCQNAGNTEVLEGYLQVEVIK